MSNSSMSSTSVTSSTTAPSTRDRPWMTGVVLIALGLLLLAAQYIQQNGWLILGGISALLIAMYVGTRKAGWLIPGFILAGLAIGVGLEEYGYSIDGSSVLLGLGGGFLAIYVFNAATGAKAHWWPLIPGGVLAVIGASLLIGGSPLAETVGRFWPLALIVVGVAILFGGIRRQGTELPKT